MPDEKIIEMIESKSQIIESDIVRQRFSKIMYDTPRKGHRPRNWLKTTLFTSAALIAIISKFI